MTSDSMKGFWILVAVVLEVQGTPPSERRSLKSTSSIPAACGDCVPQILAKPPHAPGTASGRTADFGLIVWESPSLRVSPSPPTSDFRIPNSPRPPISL
ncbi:hypothetical protein [Hydrococcus rivularis]|uniref:hypothetical protein n=1 Tax=Hydrococcus rivularis TaxID=1616834 RepID=UPI001114DE35|nr:hypothetical protein [Hydrococcus rivularis]